MMITKTGVFEIPIYKLSIPNHMEIKEKFINEIMPELEKRPPNNIGLNLYSDYFEGLARLGPEWPQLYEQTVQKFLAKAGFNQNKQWSTDIDLWYNVGIEGTYQEEHDHMGGFPSSTYSAIHYLIYDPQVHQPTAFYNPIHHTFLRNMQPCNGTDMPNDWQTPDYKPSVKEGDMLIFPSYLRHSVPLQIDKKARATIALNLTVGAPADFTLKKSISGNNNDRKN